MSDSVRAPRASFKLARTAVLDEDICRLKYVSGAREEALRRLGMERVGDLLSHIPFRYLDFSRAYTIESAPLGEICTIVGAVDKVSNRPTSKRGMTVTEVFVLDQTGVLKVAFFKQPWMTREFERGDRVAFIGKVEFAYGFKQMASPLFEKLDGLGGAGTILPVHRVGQGISQAWMRRLASVALEQVGTFVDPVPVPLRARRGLMSISRAARTIHFPRTLAEVKCARRRLAYDELLYLQLALRLRNDANLLDVRPIAHVASSHVDAMRRALPFALSDEQDAAVADILSDMADGTRVMNRLLLGDVGTGKTAVACMALASVADSGSQACVMAPTSVLARQYASKTGPLLDQAGISWGLLTGSTPPEERASLLEGLASGNVCVLFGTHAVLGDAVAFARLSLVVIDEQHRFGVSQRNTLRSKGPGADLLVMTATPIPRTLALSVYGDLDTSIIRHRPVPGAGITTKVLESPNRDIAYGALRDALSQGRQAYVVCPLVSPSEGTDELEDVPGLDVDEEGRAQQAVTLHDVETELERIRILVPDKRVEMLHGKMSARAKDEVIDAFRAGEIDVLVSTTVVEVGVDVPNATLMIIENGERFGLATLHQLRGRVGRGKLAGTCYIMTELRFKRGKRSISRDRLEALEKSRDGFELAEMDLRLRHEGEILGLRQHGGVSLRYVDLDADTDLIEAAHEDSTELLRYARSLNSVATLPLRHEVIARYGDIFKEVSGG
ncbi:MAG: ATP-dependent DNA helicase RecG [Coriobacteriaceae bacterium]|nr:ATP-dependent DNA helicase RecG [Coriobacteriaceae bacterium]